MPLIPLHIIPTVRILVVTDTRINSTAGSYNLMGAMNNAFDFELALTAVKKAPFPWVNFEILTAHRDGQNSAIAFGKIAAATAQFQNFRFDQLPPGLNLTTIDQVWLFGFAAAQDPPASQTTPALSPNELVVLHNFMDAGGGVLAMGDHEDLGSLMCSGIKRVRQMRKWVDKNAAGAPQPPALGPSRHDTTRESPPPASNYTFGGQGDKNPQPIRLKQYRLGYIPSELIFEKVRDRPHPLLCGLTGPIRVLPDHMHEGDVLGPGGISAGDPDWPGATRHEIIAWANVIAHTDVTYSNGDYGPVNATTFGAIGAYEGHDAGVGRIVVDSTWHHWVHVNLAGFVPSITNPGNPDALSQIYNYYWNVAVWLSPTAQLARMSEAAFIQALLSGGLGEIGPVGKLPTQMVGQQALDALGRTASFCNIEYFVFQGPGIPQPIPHPGLPGPGPVLRWPMLEYCAGAQIKAIAERLANGKAFETDRDAVSIRRRLQRAVADGLREMVDAELNDARSSIKALEALKEDLRKPGREL